jgi:hypothetical protein
VNETGKAEEEIKVTTIVSKEEKVKKELKV